MHLVLGMFSNFLFICSAGKARNKSRCFRLVLWFQHGSRRQISSNLSAPWMRNLSSSQQVADKSFKKKASCRQPDRYQLQRKWTSTINRSPCDCTAIDYLED
ncbi:hypothetical protein DAI22_08g064800 [Oryza sativa Japonica Group]|nr:hypothetical protein DAI22_08g064800 [Oryza sativa Japonica Group]